MDYHSCEKCLLLCRHYQECKKPTQIENGTVYTEHLKLADLSTFQDLDRQFQEITRITGRCLMEMDYLKDEKRRILENLGYSVEAKKDVGIDVIIREIMDRYDMEIKDRFVLFTARNEVGARLYFHRRL